MKRYLIFAFSTYYPSGGLGDVAEESDDREAAIESARHREGEFVYVWDRTTGEMVWDKDG